MNSYDECKAIVELDLDPIKYKLVHRESGEGWTQERATAAEAEYRRFLYLTKIFPREVIAPLLDVDTFWHYHILDTMKYARDCQTVFGYFLHHFPYVGLGGEDDKATHEQLAERMRELYEETFCQLYPALQPSRPEGSPDFSRGDANAYCAAPGQPARREDYLQALSTTTAVAYCAAPGKPGTLTAEGSAYCAAPAQPASAGFVPARRVAYCAAPAKPAGSLTGFSLTATGYCAAPGRPVRANKPHAALLSSLTTAYCAAPGQPASESRDLAYCAAPALPASARTPHAVRVTPLIT